VTRRSARRDGEELAAQQAFADRIALAAPAGDALGVFGRPDQRAQIVGEVLEHVETDDGVERTGIEVRWVPGGEIAEDDADVGAGSEARAQRLEVPRRVLAGQDEIGALGEVFAEKIHKVMDLAESVGCPMIGLNDGAGARFTVYLPTRECGRRN